MLRKMDPHLWLTLCSLFAISVGSFKGFGTGKQNWGFIEVRPKAFLFWWLHHAPVADKPLIVWFQGGPGGSSSGFGNFEEIGPLDRALNPRDHTWVKNYNVLFVDSPVGSGFSYVEDHSLLARNSTTIVNDLLTFLKDFYIIIGGLTGIDWERHVPLYIASESYGGRIAVEFADALAQQVRAGTIHCRLVGLFLGNAWLSPIDSITAWPDYLHRMGYLGEAGRERLDRKVMEVRDRITLQRSGSVLDGWHALQEAIVLETGGINCYNILKPNRKETLPSEHGSDEVLEYGETVWWHTDTVEPHTLEELMRGPVSHRLGVTDKPPWGSQRTAVFDALGDDFLQSSVATVERLLNATNIELVLYNGHLDLITCLPGTVAWVNRMFHPGNDFTPRHEPFLANNAIEGYRTSYSSRLTLYTVLRAGHMVPADNPIAMGHILRMHITDGKFL